MPRFLKVACMDGAASAHIHDRQCTQMEQAERPHTRQVACKHATSGVNQKSRGSKGKQCGLAHQGPGPKEPLFQTLEEYKVTVNSVVHAVLLPVSVLDCRRCGVHASCKDGVFTRAPATPFVCHMQPHKKLCCAP